MPTCSSTPFSFLCCVNTKTRNDKQQHETVDLGDDTMYTSKNNESEQKEDEVVVATPPSSLAWRNRQELNTRSSAGKNRMHTSFESTMKVNKLTLETSRSKEEYDSALNILKTTWGVKVENENSHDFQAPVNRSSLNSIQDAIVVTEGWNKALAFRSMFSEALIVRWRLLVAMSDDNDLNNSTAEPSDIVHDLMGSLKGLLAVSSRTSSSPSSTSEAVLLAAMSLVERNNDPLALYLGSRIQTLEILVVGMLDMAVRELCPHNQIIQREAYRSLQGSRDPDPSISNSFSHKDECKSLDGYCLLFARFGMKMKHWISFCEAFIWAIETHNPYAHQEQDIDEFAKPLGKSSYAMFVAGRVAFPMLQASFRYEILLCDEIFTRLQVNYSTNLLGDKELTYHIGTHIFNEVFRHTPELLDYFSSDELIGLGHDFMKLMADIVGNIHHIRINDSELRQRLMEQGELWRQNGVPVHTLTLIGNEYLACIKPHLHYYDIEDSTLEERLLDALAYLYNESIFFIMTPMLIDSNLLTEAKKFYKQVADELNWSDKALELRMSEIKSEVSVTGTYTQTGEEIEIGARLAWRNSSKCIGRISWNTLQVRDCRHLFSPDTIFREIEEHIKIASGGPNIQSVMTVFRPQLSHETWGMRFWSSQLYRYAGYEQKNGEVLGDPANAEFTEYLINSKLWSPPSPRSSFDLLPLVLKMPMVHKPFVYELKPNLVHEVSLDHPQHPAIKDLNLKWSSIPAITNFKMNLGGIKYPCMPFNGWFLSTEIARNLLERYNLTNSLANAMKISLDDRMLAQKVSAELENVILHSFEKNGYTIVDPMTIGKSFLTHCKRERQSERECPAQWSWIGGLVGPTNPTWHLEMRDFKIDPLYDYCCDPWKVTMFDGETNGNINDLDESAHRQKNFNLNPNPNNAKMPKVLIAFGSETGTCEVVANSLARRLKLCAPKVMSLNDVLSQTNFPSHDYTHFLAICSTFGNGEPPSNAVRFFNSHLKAEKMREISWAVLGLGSSLYPKFCQAGKDLHTKLSQTGGNNLAKLTCIDGISSASQSGGIDKWYDLVYKRILPDSLLSDLANSLRISTNKENLHRETTYTMKWTPTMDLNEERLTELKPLSCSSDDTTSTCVNNVELFVDGDISLRSSRQVEFELPKGTTTTYETGDHLAVSPINDFELIQRFLLCFSHDLEKAANLNMISKKKGDDQTFSSIIRQAQQQFYIEAVDNEGQKEAFVDIEYLTNYSLLEVLQAHVDLSLSKGSYVNDLIEMMLQRLSTSSNISSNKHDIFEAFARSIQKGTDEDRLDAMAQFPTIVHLLEEYGSLFCVPTPDSKSPPLLSIADVLVLMPRLNQRYYSISSSALTSPTRATITVGVVNIQTKYGVTVKGVCSHYLARLMPGDKAKVSVRKSTFRPPKDKGAPMVMIGGGTGIAPFMGFINERSKSWFTGSNAKTQECVLYFGCKSRNEILYRDLLASYKGANIMDLHLTMSAEPSLPKTYVQDKLQHDAKKVVKLLKTDNAHFYICGDARMAAGVTNTCVEILTKSGGMSRFAAVQLITQMQIENRWQLDVWGHADFSKVLKVKSVGRRSLGQSVTWSGFVVQDVEDK